MKKEFKIGLAGIVALVTLFFGIKFLKGKSLFSVTNEYYVTFVDAKGLTKSSTVFVDGFEAGIVSNIQYDYARPGHIVVEVSLDPKMVLCEGTKVMLNSGLMGGCHMNIVPAPISDTRYMPGDTIPGMEEFSLMGEAENLVPKINDIANKLDTLITSLNTLVNNPSLPKILNNVEQVTQDLTVTTHHLNTIVGKDLPTLTNTYNKVGENVLALTDNLKSVDFHATMDSVNMTISNVNGIMKQIANPEGTLGALMYDRGLYNSLYKTVGSIDSLMVDIKARPKRYVHFSVFGSKTK
jgi:phospholipid/cholesterol/gamma-HCH transport system substrate-binding protein